MAPSVEWDTHLHYNFSSTFWTQSQTERCLESLFTSQVHRLTWLTTLMDAIYSTFFLNKHCFQFYHLLIIPPSPVLRRFSLWICWCKYVQSFNAGWYLSLHWEVSLWIFIFWQVIWQSTNLPVKTLKSKEIQKTCCISLLAGLRFYL